MRCWDCKVTGTHDGQKKTIRFIIFAPNDRDAARWEAMKQAAAHRLENASLDKIVNMGTSNHVEVAHPAPFAKTEAGRQRRREKKLRRKQKQRGESGEHVDQDKGSAEVPS